MKMSCGCVSKASLKSRSITSAPSFLSTGPVTLSKRKMRLLWCDLFLTNPCWLFLITLFSSRCLQIDCSIIYLCIFLSIKVKLTGLQFSGSSYFPFSKIDTVFAFLPSSGTSPILHELSEIIASSSEITPASSWSTYSRVHLIRICCLENIQRIWIFLNLFNLFSCILNNLLQL